jgi:hypothetical protein
MKKILLIIFLTTFISNKSFAETTTDFISNQFKQADSPAMKLFAKQLRALSFDCSYKIRSKHNNYTASVCYYRDIPKPINCIMIMQGNNNFVQLSCSNDKIESKEEFLQLSLDLLTANNFKIAFNPKLRKIKNFLEENKMDCNMTMNFGDLEDNNISAKKCFGHNIYLGTILAPNLEPSILLVDKFPI